jgi:ribose transport system ATP-binding protein
LPSSDDYLVLNQISKRYGGVRALEGVDFACRRGSIHAVLGENGAGKSTLIKIVAGVVRPDAGTLTLEGAARDFRNPAEATKAGVVCIFQELSLMPDLSVAENVSISAPPRRLGLIDSRAQRRLAEKLLAEIGCEDVNPLSRVRDLPLSRRQMVEIAKAMGHKPRLLILDEATSALTSADVEKVYRLLARLKAEGAAILYISHRMHEVEALADRASVFRNGRHIESFDKGARSTAEIVQLMIGRDIATQYPPKPAPRAREPALRVGDLNWENKLSDISLDVGVGEIVGLGGLDGQGQKMLLLALFGVLRGVGGRIEVNGRVVRMRSPAQAKSRDIGIALVPEDRKTEGLMLAMSIGENLTLASLGSLAAGPFIDPAKEAEAIKQGVERLRIKIGAPEDPVSTLSGGNQQKVVVAKWLMTSPRVVLFNDPTRGIDVGAKQEIYRLMRELADQGAAILFYSTDYDELIGCCDRVAIMYDGRIVRELKGAEITETNIVASSLNVEEAAHV